MLEASAFEVVSARYYASDEEPHVVHTIGYGRFKRYVSRAAEKLIPSTRYMISVIARKKSLADKRKQCNDS